MRALLRMLIICNCFAAAEPVRHAEQFRFAWLSDTHVGSPTGAADLEASVQDINVMQDVAFVLLSGDVTEMGSDSELQQAKSILDKLNKPYHVIPGNHDTKWSESGCTTFRRLFGSDRFSFDYGGYSFLALHQGPIMKMGDGHFAPEDLRWLDSALEGTDRNQPLIFVTHYPLDSSIDNWYTVLDRLKGFNTQAVLLGHGHKNQAMDFEELPGVMGRSNLRAEQAAGGYTIVDVGQSAMQFMERTPGTGTMLSWHQLALGLRHDAGSTPHPRPDFSINSTYPKVKVYWETSTGHTIASTPAVWKNHVVAGDGSGTMYCKSLKDGKTEWSYTTGSSIYATPDTSDGKVVFGSTDTNVYCLDVESGRLMWKAATGAPVVGAARIDSGTVYIGGSDRTFRAIDLRSGKTRWEFHGLNGFVETKPLVDHGKVIFGAWDTCLYALNTSDGSLAWKWSNGGPGILYSPAACWPAAANGKVFIVAPDRYMTALDQTTGRVIWRSNQFPVRETIGTSQDGSRVYARCMTDNVIAFSTSSSNPEVVWNSNCGYGYDIDPSMPVERDGVVYFGTKNGLVYALDAKSGVVRWQHRIGVTIVNTPLPLGGNRVLLTDLDGRITLLGSR